VASGATQLTKAADAAGLEYSNATDALAAISDSKIKLVLIEATPANLKQLAGNMAKVNAFMQRGGYIRERGSPARQIRPDRSHLHRFERDAGAGETRLRQHLFVAASARAGHNRRRAVGECAGDSLRKTHRADLGRSYESARRRERISLPLEGVEGHSLLELLREKGTIPEGTMVS